MARNQERVGGFASHPGMLVTGSYNTVVNPTSLSRIGDFFFCVIHGISPVVTGSPNTFTNNIQNARRMDLCMCGAALLPPSPNTFTN